MDQKIVPYEKSKPLVSTAHVERPCPLHAEVTLSMKLPDFGHSATCGYFCFLGEPAKTTFKI